MTTITKGALRLLLQTAVVLLLCFFMPLCANAADGSYAVGAQLPDYDSAKEVNVVDDYDADPTGVNDSASAIQKALNVGRDEGSATNRVIVRVPKGTYKISKSLKIFSNTQLILDKDATVIKDFSSGCMLKNVMHDSSNGGYGGDCNIVIEGGIWDGNTAKYNSMYTFSNIRIAHANNVYFRNVTVKNNKNGHHMEIGGVQGLTIEGCSFSGYTGSLLKEAIQLDVMNCSELFVDYPPFDDTACDNVVIKNCTFKDLPRGLGSHSAVAGVYYTNITISDNTFDNISDICMVLYNYKHCTISGNTIRNSGAGITFNYMSDEDFRHYFKPTIGIESSKSYIDENADTVIESNTISTKKTTLRFEPFGIKLYGTNVGSATKDYPAYNYKISNVRISGNTIDSAGSAISMNNVNNCSVRDNTISAVSDSISAHLVSANSCYDIKFKENSVSSAMKSGLKADNVSGFTVSQNTFTDCAEIGVYMSAASDSSVSKNNISGCETGGIKINSSSSDITCDSNVIKDFTEFGIQIAGSGSGKDITLRSNDLSGGSVGISCVNSGKCYLSQNSFEAVADKVYAVENGMITLVKAKNFSAEEVTENRIKLTWNAVSEADGIYVFRRKAGFEDFELIATIESGALFQDERLYSGTNYFYRLVPYINIGDTAYQNTPSDDIKARTKINIETAYIDCVSEARFTGKPVTPKFTITAKNTELVLGIDYDYSYSSNVYAGTAQITVTGRGNYTGTLVYSFDITLTADRVRDSVARELTASPMYTVQPKRKYKVKCTAANAMALADSDKLKAPAERSIDAVKLFVPEMTVYSSGIWSDGGYDYI